MKKAIVFLLAVATTATVVAQSGHRNDRNSYPRKDDNAGVWNNRDRSWENNRRDNSYEFTAMERDRSIRQIHYKFDRQVEDIRRHRFMRASVKNRQIRMLEKQRAAEIREVHQRYSNGKNRYYSKGKKW